jgi:prepilin-type processing-associated H-X9-DG protein
MDGLTTTDQAKARSLRHTGGVNTGLLDGHARWFAKEETARVDTDGHGSYWLHYAAADR